MKNNIYICKTTWEIFVSILLAHDIYHHRGKKSKFIIEIAEENIPFIEKLSAFEFVSEVIPVKLSANKYIRALFFYYRIKIFLPKVLDRFLDKDCRVNLFIDQGVFGQFFLKNNKEVYLYEHGNGNYCVGAYPNHKWIKKLLGITEGYGRHNLIKEVYLQYPDKAPKDIRNKVVGFSIRKLFSSLNSKHKESIFSFFGIDNMQSSNDVILLTQPISEDGFYSENEKIEIYKNIIKKQDLNEQMNLVIKPHPRDMTDYKKHIPGITVLSRNFPMEILNFTDIRFSKAITICSSAVYNFEYDITVDYLGTIKYPKLIKALGSLPAQYVKKENYRDIQY